MMTVVDKVRMICEALVLLFFREEHGLEHPPFKFFALWTCSVISVTTFSATLEKASAVS